MLETSRPATARRTKDGKRAQADGAFVPIGVEARYPAPRARIHHDHSKSWLRRAVPLVRAHWFVLTSSLVLSLAGLIIQVWIPNIVRHAIDNAIRAHSAPLTHYFWWIVGLALVRGVLGYFAWYCSLRTGFEIEFDLRNAIYEHLTQMSFPFYDRVQSGQLISRANSDIRAVQTYLAYGPWWIVQVGIAFVAFAFMLSINAILACVVMATMPVVHIVGIRLRRQMFPVSWLIQSRLAEVATIVDENVTGVRVVKAFAGEEQELRELATAAERVQWSYVKDADIRAKWSPTLENLPRVGLVLVLVVGGWMAIHGNTTIGTIVAFNSYMLMLQWPFRQLGMLLMMGQRASASANRIYEILDEAPEIVDREGAVDLVDCRGEVRFENVDFDYPNGHRVLSGLSLHLEPVETVALVGRTGSGKSTVGRLIGRFYDVAGGTVRVDGHDVRDVTLTSLRRAVGVVLDEPFLFSVSIRDNIAYGLPEADQRAVEAAARAAGAEEFILNLPEGYDTVVGERGYTLSGGQRQRIAIARTLLVNPPVLILDDATSAIDVQVEHQIHEALRELMRDRTTLIIAHRLSTISLADRVVLIEDGRIVADGTHAELLASEPLYAEVLTQVEEVDG
jgi:ATP-binding cassette subfamily B protein